MIVAMILRDAFLAILLPRTVSGSRRLAPRFTNRLWSLANLLVRPGTKNEDVWLSLFGPLSIVLLLGLWATIMIIGFAMITYGLQLPTSQGLLDLNTSIYASGVTFFTLGFGDIVFTTELGRVVSVIEAGTGFGFLAIIISYLPVLYQSFSRREVLITLMDARGGSPPSGAELLARFAEKEDWDGLTDWLQRWETWSAELLETHLSYPTLAYYRSQHSDTSWLCAMTAVMDSCAILLSTIPQSESCKVTQRQAHLTLAMCRHAVVDLSQIFGIAPSKVVNRLNESAFAEVDARLRSAGIHMQDGSHAALQAAALQYEPYVEALGKRFRLKLPNWTKDPAEKDNWQSGSVSSHMV